MCVLDVMGCEVARRDGAKRFEMQACFREVAGNKRRGQKQRKNSKGW